MNLLQIQKKAETGQTLSPKEMLAWTQHLRLRMHRRRSSISDTDDGFNIHHSMDVEPMIQGVKMMSDAQLQTPVKDRQGRTYLGSVDPLTAVNWAKESGTKLYSKEWKEYALKQLKSSDYSQFRAAPIKGYI